MVPSARRPQATCSTKIEMPADPPQDHLDEHALVNLNEQFRDNPAAGIRAQK
jgi:hypothetical protein